MKAWQRLLLALAPVGLLVLVAGSASASGAGLAFGVRILLIGDSLSVGKASPGGQLAQLLRSAGASVKVNALGGRSALSFRNGTTNGETAGGLVQLHQDITSFRPDLVIFMLGTNDEANIAEGSGQSPQIAAWRELIEFAHSEHVKQVLIVGPPAFEPSLSQYKKHNIPEIEGPFIASLAALPGAELIDSRPLTSDHTIKGRPVEKSTGRAIHFTESAAKVWAERLYKAITGEHPPTPLSALESVLQWRPLLETSIARNSPKVPLALAFAVMQEESGGNPHLTSSAGAKGLLQVMPKTFTGQIDPATGKHFDLADIFDPAKNIEAGIQVLAWLMKGYTGAADHFWERVLTGYNAGPGKDFELTGTNDWRREEYWRPILQHVPLYEEAINGD